MPDGDYILRASEAHKEHTYDTADEPVRVEAAASGMVIAVPLKLLPRLRRTLALNPESR